MAAGPPDETDAARSPAPEPEAHRPVSGVVPALVVPESEEDDDDDEVFAIPDASEDILAEHPLPDLRDDAPAEDRAELDSAPPPEPAPSPADASDVSDVSDVSDAADAAEDGEAPPEAEAATPEALPPEAVALGYTLDTLTDGLLLDFEAPAPPRRAPDPAPASEGSALPAFEAPAVSGHGAATDEPELTSFPEPDRLPFADAPPSSRSRPSRVRPEARVPRKSERHALPAPTPSATAIGIDLGTTNCCAAVVSDGSAYVLTSRLGTSTMPSAVSFTEDGDVLVGRPALERAATAPAHTITGSKRLVGRPFHSPVVQDIREHFAYAIVEGDEGEAAVDIGEGDVVSLEEVSAYLLREVRESASLLLNEPITRAVITCPAFYNERQREAVRVAGELAGLIVERVLSEPTAAALNFGYGRDLSTRRVAVYDLGGGTFDVSILELDGSVYEVMATGGDTFLGGVDFDATIAELVVEQLVEQGAPDPRRDAAALARLMDAAEQAKRALAVRPSTILHVSALAVGRSEPFDVSLPLRRDDVDPRLGPLLDRTAEIVEDVCQRAGIRPFEVDDVLLVGGQTRYPAVADRVAQIFGRRPRATVNPDEAVALGAAQYAVGMNTIDNVVLIDALPMSIGVGLPGGRFLPVLDRDQRLPAQGSCILPTSKKNQRSMEVWFFQGEGSTIAQTEPLGRLEIEGLPPGPIGSTTVIIEAHVTGESVLEVRARDQTGGRAFTSRFATRSTPEHLREKLGLPKPPPHRPGSGDGPTRAWAWLTSLFR